MNAASRVIVVLVISILVGTPIPSAAEETSSAEIDRSVWSVVSQTVIDHDIAGMAETYHPDGVLVSERGTVVIADQLDKWGQDMEDAKAAGATATVSFRFKTRHDGPKTAFEVGMFKYTQIDGAGKEAPVYVPFEALLVKKDGRWLIVMERQFAPTDQAAWDAM